MLMADKVISMLEHPTQWKINKMFLKHKTEPIIINTNFISLFDVICGVTKIYYDWESMDISLIQRYKLRKAILNLKKHIELIDI